MLQAELYYFIEVSIEFVLKKREHVLHTVIQELPFGFLFLFLLTEVIKYIAA